MTKRHITDRRHLLADLAREGQANRRETSLVVSAGDRTTACAAKIKSHAAYNVYKVRRVAIEDTGVSPTEFGEEVEAINLAESFLSQGTLSTGAHIVLCRAGEKHVFYATP